MVIFNNDLEEAGMRAGHLFLKLRNYHLFDNIFFVIIYLSFFFVLFFLLNNMLEWVASPNAWVVISIACVSVATPWWHPRSRQCQIETNSSYFPTKTSAFSVFFSCFLFFLFSSLCGLFLGCGSLDPFLLFRFLLLCFFFCYLWLVL